jgi:CRP-like cAMP-binding protein
VAFLRSASSKVALLRKVPLFGGLSQRQLAQVAQLTDEAEVPAGRRLATVGDVGRELFIIVEGEATVTLKDRRTIRLGPGEFFGEMSVIDGGPRSATVDAATPMKLLVVANREFWGLLSEAPQLASKIMRTMSQRLRDAEEAHTA